MPMLGADITMFRHASMRAKASLVLGFALALVLAIGLFGLVALQQVNEATNEIRSVWVPKIEALDDLKRAASATAGLAMGRTQTSSFRQIAELEKLLVLQQEKLAFAERVLRPMLQSTFEQDLAAQFGQHWERFETTFRTALERIEAGETAGAQAQFNNIGLTDAARAEAALDSMIGFSKQEMNREVDRAEQIYRLFVLMTIIVIAVGAALSGAMILWTSRQVTTPMTSVAAAMRRLTAGDTSVALDPQPMRKDEIGALIEAVAGYRESLVLSNRLTAEVIAERELLHAAVTNMPIGLCMYDRDYNLIICNKRYAEIYDIPSELTATGTPIREIVYHRTKRDFVGAAIDRHIDDVMHYLTIGGSGTRHAVIGNGRTISITNELLPGGGGIGTHEDITDRRRAEAQIRHMARHDALTDLPNRILFKERVEDALKRMPRGESLAVLCLDLDQFKAVNDTLGHPFGDTLLMQVADRLRATLRESDTVGRFGGDEFALARVGGAQPQDVTALAERLAETLSAPYEIDGHQALIGVSIGIAIAPADGGNPDQLLKNADMALYRAKADGRGTYRFFEPEMDARMQARRTLEFDLRRALIRHEFEVYYQPVVQVASSAIVGFEALVRWHHPTRGLVMPGEFIPLAEEIGLIVPLGEWVLRQACIEATSWPDDIKVAVNLSPAQFKTRKVLETVIAALAASKLSSRRLELEITEGVLLVDHEATLAVLHQLRGLGVKIAMDDFGTGYSSLSYLRSFPFDKIKIDSSFIRNIDDDESSLAIIRAVTGLSTSLGMATTAEGVETREQLDRVSAEGCAEVQGFLFSKAVPASELGDLLAKYHAKQAAA